MKRDEKDFSDPEVRRYELSFRDPMLVEYAPVTDNGEKVIKALCPRCRKPLRRAWQNFCTECGQKLDWGTLNANSPM